MDQSRIESMLATLDLEEAKNPFDDNSDEEQFTSYASAVKATTVRVSAPARVPTFAAASAAAHAPQKVEERVREFVHIPQQESLLHVESPSWSERTANSAAKYSAVLPTASRFASKPAQNQAVGQKKDMAEYEANESKIAAYHAEKKREAAYSQQNLNANAGFLPQFHSASAPLSKLQTSNFLATETEKCEAQTSVDSEQQHYGMSHGVDALKRVVSHGEPARINLALGRANKLEIFAKRSEKQPHIVMVGTRLNESDPTAKPVLLMTMNSRSGHSKVDLDWAKKMQEMNVHDTELLKSAICAATEMLTSAGIHDAAKVHAVSSSDYN